MLKKNKQNCNSNSNSNSRSNSDIFTIITTAKKNNNSNNDINRDTTRPKIMAIGPSEKMDGHSIKCMSFPRAGDLLKRRHSFGTVVRPNGPISIASPLTSPTPPYQETIINQNNNDNIDACRTSPAPYTNLST